MIMRDITSVLPTKNTRSKVVNKISNSGELDVPYLAALCCAVIIIGHPAIKFQQLRGTPLNSVDGT